NRINHKDDDSILRREIRPIYFCYGMYEKVFMAFIRMKGTEGLLYVPDEDGPKKYPCADCHFCQWCSDNRCSLCINRKACGRKARGGDAPGKVCPGDTVERKT
ncbi:hypothetical protein EG833_01220, partial [archaeon]|nr:hypothetical protein [archaeon]